MPGASSASRAVSPTTSCFSSSSRLPRNCVEKRTQILFFSRSSTQWSPLRTLEWSVAVLSELIIFWVICITSAQLSTQWCVSIGRNRKLSLFLIAFLITQVWSVSSYNSICNSAVDQKACFVLLIIETLSLWQYDFHYHSKTFFVNEPKTWVVINH